jgi:hypothetical protein
LTVSEPGVVLSVIAEGKLELSAIFIVYTNSFGQSAGTSFNLGISSSICASEMKYVIGSKELIGLIYRTQVISKLKLVVSVKPEKSSVTSKSILCKPVSRGFLVSIFKVGPKTGSIVIEM